MNDRMEIDIRKHPQIRADVRTGLLALRVQGRQIWGEKQLHTLDEIVVRLMVGVGDLARFTRDRWQVTEKVADEKTTSVSIRDVSDENELKKELGNIVFSTIRWIDDLGLDPLECLDLAIAAQEKFAQSGRPR